MRLFRQAPLLPIVLLVLGVKEAEADTEVEEEVIEELTIVGDGFNESRQGFNNSGVVISLPLTMVDGVAGVDRPSESAIGL